MSKKTEMPQEGQSQKQGSDRTGLATVPEVASFLRISRAKAYTMMDNGDLAYIKLGKSRRIRWEDVDALIAANLIGA